MIIRDQFKKKDTSLSLAAISTTALVLYHCIAEPILVGSGSSKASVDDNKIKRITSNLLITSLLYVASIHC
jgi:hypothetical protein